jgi:DNA-binding NtrC family response regulator
MSSPAMNIADRVVRALKPISAISTAKSRRHLRHGDQERRAPDARSSSCKQAGGNQTLAAEMLGINRNTLRKKLTEHNWL